jgi:hypothetical protein
MRSPAGCPMTTSHAASSLLVFVAWSVRGSWLHPSRYAVNTTLWGLGIVLQTALVYFLFRRSVVRSFPAFAALAVFYPVRSLLLFILSSRIEADDYSTVHSVASLLEAPLLALVAFELLWRRARERGGWGAGFSPWALLLLLAPLGLTAITMNAMPARVEADRVTLFMGFVMLMVFAFIVKGTRSVNAVRISGGFACFALAQFAALAARAHAMLLRDTPAYIAWGYLPVATYLAIVLFWIVALRREAGAVQGTGRRAVVHVVSS